MLAQKMSEVWKKFIILGHFTPVKRNQKVPLGNNLYAKRITYIMRFVVCQYISVFIVLLI
jgi:hypothetical protein